MRTGAIGTGVYPLAPDAGTGASRPPRPLATDPRGAAAAARSRTRARARRAGARARAGAPAGARAGSRLMDAPDFLQAVVGYRAWHVEDDGLLRPWTFQKLPWKPG